MQTIHSFSSLFIHPIYHLQTALQEISSWMTANLLTLNFLSSDSNNNEPRYKTSFSAPPTLLAISASSSMSFSDQITALAKSCNFYIRQLCCIRSFFDIRTASTIATSNRLLQTQLLQLTILQSPKSQLSGLKLNTSRTLVRAVVKAPQILTPLLFFSGKSN